MKYPFIKTRFRLKFPRLAGKICIANFKRNKLHFCGACYLATKRKTFKRGLESRIFIIHGDTHHLTLRMFVCGVDPLYSLTVLLPITVMSALELASLRLHYVLQALKYRSITDIVRPIREIVRRGEETVGHSVRPKWN